MPETAEVTQVLQAIGRNEEGAAKKLLPLDASARRSALKKNLIYFGATGLCLSHERLMDK
jgi:hypothetical protein